MVNKKADVVRVYPSPPDANTLLSVTDHCLQQHYVNVVVAGKQPALHNTCRWTTRSSTAPGLGIWEWASNDDGPDGPDVLVMAAGDRAHDGDAGRSVAAAQHHRRCGSGS